MTQAQDYVSIHALRAIAVEAIREVTGCPDIGNNGKYLVSEIERIGALAAKRLSELEASHPVMHQDARSWLESQRIDGGPHGFESVGVEALSRMWAAAVASAQPAKLVPMTSEWWHEVLGTAGQEFLEVAKQWGENKIHVYQVVNEGERIAKAVANRAIEAHHNITSKE